MPFQRTPRQPQQEHRLPEGVEFWAKTTAEGKPGISVLEHCLNVGAVARALLERFPPPWGENDAGFYAILAAMHDAGKITPGFQAQCEAWLVQHGLKEMALKQRWTELERDHAKVSQHTLQTLCEGSERRRWAPALGAHHGRPKGMSVKCPRDWLEHRRRLVEAIEARMGQLPERGPRSETELCWAAGLITVADWIGSDERFFPPDGRNSGRDCEEAAASALEQIGWRRPEIRRGLRFEELFPGLRPNALQEAAQREIREPGVYVIEGPMGCGKTEAALAAAYGLLESGQACGLYFGLPTQLTSNRIYLRVRDFIGRITDGRAGVRLAHGSSWLLEQELALQAGRIGYDEEGRPTGVADCRSWFASSRRALLEPFGVGTVDQALLGVVAAKHFFLRQFALAGKVVILDEVHSYDLYTGTLVDALIRRLRELGATVIVLSATLTKGRRAQVLGVENTAAASDAYPLLSASGQRVREAVCKAPRDKRVAVRWLEESALAQEALEAAERGRCVLWIRNTVAEAQQTYRALKSAIQEGGPGLGLLHSRFPLYRREEIENHWMQALGRHGERPKGCVLVATQVVEQSVDVDADLLITDLAPTDMLFQRIGRLHRHRRDNRAPGRAEVILRRPSDEPCLKGDDPAAIRESLGRSARVYPPYVLLRTWSEWRELTSVRVPGQIREILERTYEERNREPAAWEQLREKMRQKMAELRGKAENATRVWALPPLEDDEGVQTRYETAPTAHILLARRIELQGGEAELRFPRGERIVCRENAWEFAAAKAIHRRLIRAPFWALKEGLEQRLQWLKTYADSCAAGLLRHDGTIVWADGETEAGMTYSEEIGLWIEPEKVRRISMMEGEAWNESCF
jgi:CRISPR-associated endonuclease/helicase Cas3